MRATPEEGNVPGEQGSAIEQGSATWPRLFLRRQLGYTEIRFC